MKFDQIIHKKLEAASKEVYKDITQHFKKDGWDLWYGFYTTEVFYRAFGFQAEKYLLNKILDKKSCCTISVKDGEVLLTKKSKIKKRKRKK